MKSLKSKQFLYKFFLHVIIFIVMLCILLPIYWMIITSIKLPKEWVTYPPTFVPSRVFLETYKEVLGEEDVIRSLINTIIVTVSGTALSLMIGAMTAYSLARINLKFNRPLTVWIVMNRMLPPVTLVIPFFIIMRNLGIIDTLLALIITRIFLVFPFIVWIMLGFYKGIPIELDEAAKIDGCDFFNRFFRIGLPLSAVGLATAGIFVFVFSWKELLFSITVAVERAKTLPVYIAGFVSEDSFDWGPMTVLSVISTIPIMIFAFSIQKYFIRGLTLGAVKG
jgi:multiple sugar transport system permease protein